MIFKLFLALGLIVLTGTSWFIVGSPPADFQLSQKVALVTELQKSGVLPPSGDIKENEAAEYGVFEVPPMDEMMLAAAMKNMGNMSGMKMDGMDMSGDGGTMKMDGMDMSGDSGTMKMAEGDDGAMDMSGDSGTMKMAEGDDGAMDMSGDSGTMKMAEGDDGAMDMSGDSGTMKMDGMDMSDDNGTMKMAEGDDGTMDMSDDSGTMKMAEGDDGAMDMSDGSGTMKMAEGDDGTMDMSDGSGTMKMAEGDDGTMDMSDGSGTMKMAEGNDSTMDMSGDSGTMKMAEGNDSTMEVTEGQAETGCHIDGGLSVCPDGANADREITLSMREWDFDKMNIEVKKGEKIRFTIRNDGKTLHEFMFMTMPLMQAVEYRAKRADWSLYEHEAVFEKSLLLPGQDMSFIVDVQQSGSWMFMCMLPYHMQLGMMGQMATPGAAMKM